MTEHDLIIDAKSLSRWQRHKFLLLVGITIVASLFLVGVALSLYSSSGASQLDLSRPGYQSVRAKVSRNDNFNGYPADGPVDKKSLDSFRTIYQKRSDQAIAINGFSGDVLDTSLLLTDAAPPQKP